MFGPVSIQRLSLVQPTLRQTMMILETQMSEAIGITQGLRKSQEQLALWSQGRFPLGVVNQRRMEVGWAPVTEEENAKTVTNAAPGYSWHEFGMAVDVVPFDSQMHADWNETHPVWQEIMQKGAALGLTSGKSWKDEPHFQLTGRFPVTPTDEARTIQMTKGLDGVWEAAQIGSIQT